MKIITVILALVTIKAFAAETENLPYGAQFGQLFDSSEHQTIQRRGNIKSVLLKTADRPKDTEKLSAEICDNSGLQILTWESHIRSSISAIASHEEILLKLKKKYGNPKIHKNSAFWLTEKFQIVAKIRRRNKTYQNQIRYFGPKYKPCFKKFKDYKATFEQPSNKGE
jgi:hypothetical protein